MSDLTEQVVEAVIDSLCERDGFYSWWDTVPTGVKVHIKKTCGKAVDPLLWPPDDKRMP